ncbi:4-hydroxy-tetrahydrodipicolinate reductase [Deltaproteobacteria bacterium PRO3]|nr:4-hydroxy-tetrahydrodipicolinate reductase [Deltaproteobacteria bacterium PRO3]
MTRIIVTGVAGRMGSRIADIVRQSGGLTLAGATESPGSFAVGTLLPEGHQVVDDLAKNIEHADVVIDFTSPKATLRHAEICAQHDKALVVGTTGFGPEEREKLLPLLKKIPSVFSSNMSIGMNVMFKTAARMATLLGEDYDIEIFEAHHRHKKDAPSGTALTLAEEIAAAVGRDLGKVARYERHGQIGARPPREIGIQTLRGGDIVGDHTVYFAGEGERLEITHRATSRDNFARGAVLAAKWVAAKSPGVYTMFDVLGLE